MAGKRSFIGALTAILALTFVTGCGGDDTAGPSPVSTAPTPTPSPSSTPTPSPFVPVLARIFEDPTLTGDFYITGGGWLRDTMSGEDRQVVVDKTVLDLVWEGAIGGYRMVSGEYGSGVLLRTGNYYTYSFAVPPYAYRSLFPANIQNRSDPWEFAMTMLETRLTDDPYNHVTAFDPYKYQTRQDGTLRASWVWVGAAQRTPENRSPTAGIASFQGDLVGTMSSNLGDMVVGAADFHIDYGGRTITGFVDVYPRCFMGCSYPPTRYTLAEGTIDPSEGTITARLVGPGHGELSGGVVGELHGVFAGPAGQEALLRTSFSYINPERPRNDTVGGVILLRKTP